MLNDALGLMVSSALTRGSQLFSDVEVLAMRQGSLPTVLDFYIVFSKHPLYFNRRKERD